MRQPSGMIILKDQKTRRELRRIRRTFEGYGSAYVAGHEILTYEVALDMHAISVMATKAGGNRTGRAKSGPVTVVITGRVPEHPEVGRIRVEVQKQDLDSILSGLDARKETKQ